MKESRKEELILVGEYNIELNDILDINIEKMKIFQLIAGWFTQMKSLKNILKISV